MEQFELYAFVGLKEEKKENIVTNTSQRTYFIREILSDGMYLCDIYNGENLFEKHYIVKLPTNKYEIKKVKATYKIREFYQSTATWIDNPRVFGSITEIENAVTNGEVKTQFWEVWELSIYCDSSCKKFGIDPTAPWPPKAL